MKGYDVIKHKDDDDVKTGFSNSEPRTTRGLRAVACTLKKTGKKTNYGLNNPQNSPFFGGGCFDPHCWTPFYLEYLQYYGLTK